MSENIPLPFDLPAVARNRVSAAFDGGRITSDGGVMLLAQAELRISIADRLARVSRLAAIVHLLPDILRARIFAIACGHQDADDLDWLLFDPALSEAEARRRFFAIDRDGLLIEGMPGVLDFQKAFVQPAAAVASWSRRHPDKIGLVDVVANAKPNGFGVRTVVT